jgi:hypothetical protein
MAVREKMGGHSEISQIKNILATINCPINTKTIESAVSLP